MLAATRLGDYTLFAGGFLDKNASDAVDIFYHGRYLRTDRLSEPRGLLAATSLHDLAFFAGGSNLETKNKSAAVDIFNATSGTWSVAELSIPRDMLTATSVGSLAMFAGGERREDESHPKLSDDCARVDIYSYITRKWTTQELSYPRKKLAAASPSNEIAIFGGGYRSGAGDTAVWDLYNATSGEWTAGNLSASRMRLEASSAAGKAFFISGMGKRCGAFCPQVDVYDTHTQQWSALQLTRGRYEFAAVGVGEQVVVTGGKQNGSTTAGAWSLVERITAGTETVTVQAVPVEARSYIAAAPHRVPTVDGRSEEVVLVAGGDCQNGTTTAFVDVLRQ